MTLVWELVGGFSGLLRLTAGFVAAFALFSMWNAAFDNPRVVNEARREYVQIAQLEAEQAKSAELQRQVNAGAQAFEEYRKKLAAFEAKDAVDDAAREAKIAEMELAVKAAGRSCTMDDADIKFFGGH
jgi:hypothetical protein